MIKQEQCMHMPKLDCRCSIFSENFPSNRDVTLSKTLWLLPILVVKVSFADTEQLVQVWSKSSVTTEIITNIKVSTRRRCRGLWQYKCFFESNRGKNLFEHIIELTNYTIKPCTTELITSQQGNLINSLPSQRMVWIQQSFLHLTKDAQMV